MILKQDVEVIIDLRYNTYEVYDLNERFLGCYNTIKDIQKEYNII